MKRNKCIRLIPLQILAGILILFASPMGAGYSGHSPIPIGFWSEIRAELDIQATPEMADCRNLTRTPNRETWYCSDYLLELVRQQRDGTGIFRFTLKRADGSPFQVGEYRFSVTVPGAPDDALFSYNRPPDRSIMETDLSQPWESFSAANRGIPYLALVDRTGQNRLAVGLLSQEQTVLLQAEKSGDPQEYRITLQGEENPKSDFFSGGFYVSSTRNTWFANARNYTAMVDRLRSYQAPEIPPAAFYPTYDTWYWTQDRIDQKLLWEMAGKSQSLGFRTFLIDAGWDTRPGQYFEWLEGSTGDYTPPPESFPDFSGLVSRIQTELNMKVMLWIQQYALGRRSMYYPVIGSALTWILDGKTGRLEETVALCPQMEATRQHMTRLFEGIIRRYHPDAFWFDWQEDIPPKCHSPLHEHDDGHLGAGYNRTQQAITETIRQLAPGVYIDMRWPFANLNNKPHSQIWQPYDSPGDFETMRLQALIMRPFSAGLVMGTDEMYWPPSVPDTEAARFMAAVVFTGVPYFGPDLRQISGFQAEMLKAWLRFYETNQADLTGGVFAPYGDRDHPDQLIEGRDTSFIYYSGRHEGPVPLKRSNQKIVIVNNSSTPWMDLSFNGLVAGEYRADITDLLLRGGRQISTLRLEQSSRLQREIPTGCLLRLTRTGG